MGIDDYNDAMTSSLLLLQVPLAFPMASMASMTSITSAAINADRSLSLVDGTTTASAAAYYVDDVPADVCRPVVGRLVAADPRRPAAVRRVPQPWTDTRKPELCQVCDNVGATMHYGGTVCGGCKIFFARAVQSQRGFVCDRNSTCKMTAGKRSKCRACRFQRCLRAQMSPNEVGKLRELRMSDKSTTTTSSTAAATAVKRSEGSVVGYYDESSVPSTSMCDRSKQVVSFVDALSTCKGVVGVVAVFVNLESSCNNDGAHKMAAMFQNSCSLSVPLDDAIKFPIPICERIPMRWCREQFLLQPTEMLKLFYARTLVHYLDWAAAIEDLFQIAECDRRGLIVSSMCPCSLLTHAFGVSRSKVDSESACSPFEFGPFACTSKKAQRVLDKFHTHVLVPVQKLEMSDYEYVLLKIIILFTSRAAGEYESPKDSQRIRAYRDKYCVLLHALVRETRSSSFTESALIHRVANLVAFANAIVNVASYFDSWLALMFVTNACEMRDSLVYELHVHPNFSRPAPSGCTRPSKEPSKPAHTHRSTLFF